MNRLFFYKKPETIKEKLIAEIEHKKGKENFRKIIEMTSEKTKLKPCPFCGGEAKVMGSDTDPFFMVVCLKCGLKAKWYHDLRDEATIHWNERNYPVFPDSSNSSEKPNSSKESMKFEIHSAVSFDPRENYKKVIDEFKPTEFTSIGGLKRIAIEINSIEDLLRLQKAVDYPLVIDTGLNGLYTITIEETYEG